MFIQKLRVDRFNAIADLEIDELAEGITVVHGAAETGKSLLVDFVRTMFFGFDDKLRTRHAATQGSGYGGSLAIVDGRDGCTLHRHDDGTRDGRFTLERRDGSTVVGGDVERHLAGVSAGLFDAVFAVDFAERPQISTLLHEAWQSGLPLAEVGIDTQRRSQLQHTLDSRRAERAGLPKVDDTIDSLRTRRARLVAEISDTEATLVRLREEARRSAERIPELEERLRASRGELRVAERRRATLEAERRRLLDEVEAIEHAREAWQQLADELRAVEDRIERWNEVLGEVHQRRKWLHDQFLAPARGADGDPRHELRVLEQQLREFRDSVARKGIDDHRWQAPVVAKSVDEMQARVLELRRDLGWNDAGTHAECACEVQQLDRCSTELKHAVGYLDTQRKQMAERLSGRRQHDDELAELEQQLDSLDEELARAKRQQNIIQAAIDEAEVELERWRHRDPADQAVTADRLARRRLELEQLEKHLHYAERRHTLDVEIHDLQLEIERLGQQQSDSTITRAASDYLRRLSAGDYHGVTVTSDRQVFVEDPVGLRRSWHELDAGARDQVYLAFCLALADAAYNRGIDLPLVLHGAFTNYESRDVPEAAETLRDFATRGRQVLVLTRHEHVVSVFRLLNVSLRRLRARAHGEPISSADWPADGKHHLVTLLHAHHDRDLDAADSCNHTSHQAGRFATLHGARRAAVRSSVYSLHEDDPIEGAPSLDAETAARMRTLGVTTVGHLLELNPADTAADLRYGATVERIEQWQAQALLMCRVPRLRPYDARILVACGVRRPSQLERLGTAEVRDMIDRFAATSDGRAMLLSGTEYELSRITDWSRTEEPGTAREATWSGRSNASRGDRAATRRNHAAHHESGRGNGVAAVDADVIKLPETGSLRFYLSLDDPIVEAPSIGPRSAEQFEAIGILTIADFLEADPDELADQLDGRRFNADTIEQWQLQTELVCRVPFLRGHDAQILVAVDVTETEQLAEADPQQLWERVAPFVDSAAGKRIIRNGNAPDFAEVSNWIQWAGMARPLEEAA